MDNGMAVGAEGAFELLHGKPVDSYLRRCVSIVPEALATELCDVPGQVAYVNLMVTEATRKHNDADLQVKRVRARVRARLRATKDPTTGKAPTVAAVDDALDDDEEYLGALLGRAEAEGELVAAQGWAKAVQAKLAACLALSGLLREELRGDPVLRAAAQMTRG